MRLEHLFWYPSAVELRRQRIHHAQRTGLRNRIRDQWHLAEERADALIEAWDQEAQERLLRHSDPTSWRDAEVWIRERLEPRVSRSPCVRAGADPASADRRIVRA